MTCPTGTFDDLSILRQLALVRVHLASEISFAIENLNRSIRKSDHDSGCKLRPEKNKHNIWSMRTVNRPARYIAIAAYAAKA